jgi:4-carboxymuconolactone decarboxylase
MRIPAFAPDELDDEQRALYDAIAYGRRAQAGSRLTDEAGRLVGPFNAMLLQPRVGQALQSLGSAVRYDTALPDRSREIAILIVADHWHSDFEWHAHESIGRSIGLTETELAAIRARRYDVFDRDAEATLARTAHALVERGDLTDAEYDAAVAGLGPAGLFEVLTLVGYYATLALQLRVLRVPAPPSVH